MKSIEELKQFALRTGSMVTLPDGTIFNSSLRKVDSVEKKRPLRPANPSYSTKPKEPTPPPAELRVPDVTVKGMEQLVSALSVFAQSNEQHTAAIQRISTLLAQKPTQAERRPLISYDVYFTRKEGKIVSAQVIPVENQTS